MQDSVKEKLYAMRLEPMWTEFEPEDPDYRFPLAAAVDSRAVEPLDLFAQSLVAFGFSAAANESPERTMACAGECIQRFAGLIAALGKETPLVAQEAGRCLPACDDASAAASFCRLLEVRSVWQFIRAQAHLAQQGMDVLSLVFPNCHELAMAARPLDLDAGFDTCVQAFFARTRQIVDQDCGTRTRSTAVCSASQALALGADTVGNCAADAVPLAWRLLNHAMADVDDRGNGPPIEPRFPRSMARVVRGWGSEISKTVDGFWGAVESRRRAFGLELNRWSKRPQCLEASSMRNECCTAAREFPETCLKLQKCVQAKFAYTVAPSAQTVLAKIPLVLEDAAKLLSQEDGAPLLRTVETARQAAEKCVALLHDCVEAFIAEPALPKPVLPSDARAMPDFA